VGPDQTRQAIAELLENAVDFSPEGGRISVAVAGFQEHGRPMVQITVRNEGPGIAAAEKTRVFDLFYTTRAEGTGLGLAVVARIAANHSGEAYEDGEPGKCARFVLEIPTRPDQGSGAIV